MDEMTDLYVNCCLDLLIKENCSDLQILIEQKLDFSDYLKDSGPVTWLSLEMGLSMWWI